MQAHRRRAILPIRPLDSFSTTPPTMPSGGHLSERKILTGVGEVEVRVPKARSRSGSPERFRSSVAPPYVRPCASLNAAIPWL